MFDPLAPPYASKLPIWLFVAYGGGHISMVVPVALRVRDMGLARPVVLALTTAEAVCRKAGLETVGFADFTCSKDAQALAMGAKLATTLSPPPFNPTESVAYLGLSYSDLVSEKGQKEAEKAYAAFGRQSFHPLPTLRKIIQTIKPALVVATNSPRAEQAAIQAAGQLGIPSVCLVDLFSRDEKRWIGKSGFADRVCVLNEEVRQMFVREGRAPSEIVVTGNPAFDRLLDSVHVHAASAVRRRLVQDQEKLVLYAPSPEPIRHPYRDQLGNEKLPYEILDALLSWAVSRRDIRLAVRPHPSQRCAFSLASNVPATITDQQWPLEPLLHACDAVCVSISTVGLQAHLVGKPVMQVFGSMFDDAAPFADMGVATGTTLLNLAAGMDKMLTSSMLRTVSGFVAAPRVVDVLRETANLSVNTKC